MLFFIVLCQPIISLLFPFAIFSERYFLPFILLEGLFFFFGMIPQYPTKAQSVLNTLFARPSIRVLVEEVYLSFTGNPAADSDY